MHPAWTIYHSDSATVGLADRPIMERLYAFGLTIEPKEGAALDSWERAARVAHQEYLEQVWVRALDPIQAKLICLWPRAGLRSTGTNNIRLVTATLASAETIGLSLGADADGFTGAGDRRDRPEPAR